MRPLLHVYKGKNLSSVIDDTCTKNYVIELKLSCIIFVNIYIPKLIRPWTCTENSVLTVCIFMLVFNLMGVGGGRGEGIKHYKQLKQIWKRSHKYLSNASSVSKH